MYISNLTDSIALSNSGATRVTGMTETVAQYWTTNDSTLTYDGAQDKWFDITGTCSVGFLDGVGDSADISIYISKNGAAQTATTGRISRTDTSSSNKFYSVTFGHPMQLSNGDEIQVKMLSGLSSMNVKLSNFKITIKQL